MKLLQRSAALKSLVFRGHGTIRKNEQEYARIHSWARSVPFNLSSLSSACCLDKCSPTSYGLLPILAYHKWPQQPESHAIAFLMPTLTSRYLKSSFSNCSHVTDIVQVAPLGYCLRGEGRTSSKQLLEIWMLQVVAKHQTTCSQHFFMRYLFGNPGRCRASLQASSTYTICGSSSLCNACMDAITLFQSNGHCLAVLCAEEP